MHKKHFAYGLIPAMALMLTPAAANAAGEQCVLPSEAVFSGYLNRLATGFETTVDYRYSEGDGGGLGIVGRKKPIPPEKPFVRGAAALKDGDLMLTVQFDRNGMVTDVDVHRQIEYATYELLASMYGECLEPYHEDLTALNDYISGHVSYQTAEEADRKQKFEEDE